MANSGFRFPKVFSRKNRNRSKTNAQPPTSNHNTGLRPRSNTTPFNHPLYTLDKEGLIRLKSTGKQLTEQDVATHANEVFEAVVEHIHDMIRIELNFQEAYIPDVESPAKCKIFVSDDYSTSRKLLVFVASSRGLQPGIWSRNLVLQSGISTGSMIPYLRQAKEEGFGIIVANPNANSVLVSNGLDIPQALPIAGSATPEEHMEYIWDNFIAPSAARRVYFLGYAFGGVLIKHIMQVRGDQLIRRNGAVALIESGHRIEDNDRQEVKSILAHRAMYWESNELPAQTKLEGDAPHRTGCSCMSAGRPHRPGPNANAAHTIVTVMEPVFRFLKLRDATTYIQSERPAHSVTQRSANKSKSGQLLSQKDITSGNEKSCALCDFNFTLFDRRHHCRMCYRAVCNSCSPDRLFLPGASTAQRVCTECASDGSSRNVREGSRRSSQNTTDGTRKSKESLGVEDFDLLKVIGKGAFGKVMLVRKKDESTSIFAMKVLKKAAVFAKNQVEHTKSERRILRDIEHAFVVRLRYAFQTEDKLYLVMDYYNGGSLFFHLRKARKFGEARARFYAAQIVLAMAHLHKLNIAYRDLKLENILMDGNGYVALTDFGLSKENVDMPNGAKTFCGTAEYIAPELLKGLPYGKAVDWWGFGTLLYEMMTGQTPFFDRNRKRMFHNILHRDVSFNSSFSPEAKNLLTGLLRRDPAKRLGSGPTGAQEIMDHPFFSSIDWEALLRKEMSVPFRPHVAGDADTTNVANVFTREIPRDSPVTTQLGATHRAQAHFEGFTYMPNSDLSNATSAT